MLSHRRARSRSSNLPPSESALIAASAAFSHASNSNLAAAAAGAALRHAAQSPPPPEQRTGSIPTKRMLQRRDSYSSNASDTPSGVTRRNSNSSLAGRSFRKPQSPPPRSDLLSSLRPQNTPPRLGSVMSRGSLRTNPPQRRFSSSSESSGVGGGERKRGDVGEQYADSATSFASDLDSIDEHEIPLHRRRIKLSPSAFQEDEELRRRITMTDRKITTDKSITITDNRASRVPQTPEYNIAQRRRSKPNAHPDEQDLSSDHPLSPRTRHEPLNRTRAPPPPLLVPETEESPLRPRERVRAAPFARVQRDERNECSEASGGCIERGERSERRSGNERIDNERTRINRNARARNIPLSLSPPSRSPAFTTTPPEPRKHSPPSRSTSPPKSALKHPPQHADPPRRGNVRVSFSDEDSVASYSNSKPPILGLEDLPRRGDLPVFTSTRKEIEEEKKGRRETSAAIQAEAPTARTDNNSSYADSYTYTPDSPRLETVPELVSIHPTPTEEKTESHIIMEMPKSFTNPTTELKSSLLPGTFPSPSLSQHSTFGQTASAAPTSPTITNNSIHSVHSDSSDSESDDDDLFVDAHEIIPPSPQPSPAPQNIPAIMEIFPGTATTGGQPTPPHSAPNSPTLEGPTPPMPPLPSNFDLPTPTPSRRRSLTPPPRNRRRPPPQVLDDSSSETSVSSFRRSFPRSASGFRSTMRSRDGKETPGEKAMKNLRDGNFSSIISKGRGAGAEDGGNECNEGNLSSSEDVRRRLGLGIKKSTAAQPARFESSDDEPADGGDKDKKKRRWWKRKSSLPKPGKQEKEGKDREIRKSVPPALMGMGFKGKDRNGSRPGTGTTAVDSVRPATAATNATAATDATGAENGIRAPITHPVELAAEDVPPVPLVPLVRSITNPSGATMETPTAGIAAIDGTHELKKVDSNTSSKRRAGKLSRRESVMVDLTGGLPREKKGKKTEGEKDGKKIKGWKKFFGKS
ncbi:Protein of unknown function [Pyronema omphalodes CBS 100304]|uniref:Uncharacterized protein n=1 Tax=Pyronema omphalodes (strain CBS 100304) TaxID=1076935 RepID=U4KZI9_PYROM|nr:Protein of unknown function [Pyronema omphalodes CBS 100304]